MTDEETYFDTIAKGYDQLDTGMTPIRNYSEVYTLLKLVGSLDNKSVLELACSDGFFSRLLKKLNASSLLGVDLSPEMINLAREHEARQPLGINYQVGSIQDIGVLGQFDLVFTPFVMSYAKDRTELLEMCRILYQNLKPGGRLLSMNDNPHLLPDSVTGFAKYGKTKRIITPVEDGATVEVTWVAPDSQGEKQYLSFQCQYFTQEAFEWALGEVGFKKIHIHHPQVSPEGLERYGNAYWELFLKHPLLVFIEAHKSE